MKPLFYFIFLSGLLGITQNISAQNELAEAYAWHFPAPDTIRLANDLAGLLREETGKILEAGHLAPIRLAFGDLHWENYFLYQEPGRILTTLAWAWPYLDPGQQSATLDYVAAELANPAYAPWSADFTLPRTEGARREWYPSADFWGEGSNFGDFRPRLHTVYGFWLFCYRSHQTDWMTQYYEEIKSIYQSLHHRAQLYGDMNAHIAMARLAEVNGDQAQRDFSLQRLEEELQDGKYLEHKHDFAREGFYGWDAPYNRLPGSDMYDDRKDGFLYRGFIFLNMGPEVARFLRDSCWQQVDSMHQEGKNLLPMWWLMQAPYYPRWTGDENIGVPSEAFGMYHPVETWVLESGPEQLRRFMRSSPTGIGDCYWLEALVQTLEAHAVNTTWIDVRDTPFPPVVIDSSSVSAREPVAASGLVLRIAPNPAQGRVVFEIEGPEGARVWWQISDMQGRVRIPGGPVRLPAAVEADLRGLPPGAYTCFVRTQDSSVFKTQIFFSR